MSINLDNVTVRKFEAEVHQRFQERGKVGMSIRTKDAKGASSVQFPLMGRGFATQRTTVHTPIPIMNITHDPRIATVTNWTASELTDIFLNNQVNFDERQELAQSIAAALERRLDQIVIDTLVAAAPAKSVPINISGANDNLTLDALRETARLFDIDGVPDGDRTMLIHVNGLHHLLDDPEVTSSDFASIKALIKGDLDSYYGMNMIKIGNRPEETVGATAGGLPITGGLVRSNFAYHKQAVGMAMNMMPKVTVDWEPSFGAHRVTGFMSAGAVVVDDLGLIEVLTDEN